MLIPGRSTYLSVEPVKMHSMIGALLIMLTVYLIPYPAFADSCLEVPKTGRIVLQDFGFRNWGPQLVHYCFDSSLYPRERTGLQDDAGRWVPFQTDGKQLTFVAQVSKGSSATYTLLPAKQDTSDGNSTLTLENMDDGVQVSNEYLSLRMPPLQEHRYDPPLPAFEVPPPILQWKTPAFEDWVGNARFNTPRRIKSYRSRIVRSGSAVVEYEAHYQFAPRGEYLWRIRLSPRMPLAIVTEEFDMKEAGNGEDLVLLDLHTGWTPHGVNWVEQGGEQQFARTVEHEYREYLETMENRGAQAAPVGGTGTAPKAFQPGEAMALLEKLVPAGKWGGYKGGLSVTESRKNIGIVPLHAGSWRRTMALNAWHEEGTGISIGLPISVRPARWSLDIADDQSPFSTHEHDPGLSKTFGRRVWGLYVGDNLETAQAQFGYIGLDRYKNWIVDVADKVDVKAYPGALLSPDQVARVKASLEQHPDATALRRYYLVSGRGEDAIRHATEVIQRLRKPYRENDFFISGLSNYRKSELLTFVHLAEDALAYPQLPAPLREELLLLLTLYAYVMSDPDFNPRGAGVHLGNNNMTINRTLALTYFASLLPGHPLYQYWMEQVAIYTRHKLASQTMPDGTWISAPAYQLYNPIRALNTAQAALRNRGIVDLTRQHYHQATLDYLANLSVPDVRFQWPRIIPGMGNSPNLRENIWGISIATTEESDPEFAGWLRYMNNKAHGPHQRIPDRPNFTNSEMVDAFYFLPDITERAQPLTTRYFPGYGVVFRSRFGTPEETAMLFRAGVNWSHWDTDSLNVILYSRGVPLSPGTGYQYINHAMTADSGIYHNRVKVGQRNAQVIFGRVDATIKDYAFGPTVDYALAEHRFPQEIFDANLNEVQWRRHILFLKSRATEEQDYFVLRDSFKGNKGFPKWWTWLNPGGADQVKVSGNAFDPTTVAVDRSVSEASMPQKTGSIIEMQSGFDLSSWFCFDQRKKVRARMVANYATHDGLGKETKTILEISADEHQDFFYALYPLAEGQDPPICQALAKGILRIASDDNVDTVFISDTAFNWNQDDQVFSGRSGVIRVRDNQVVLAMTSGSGRIGYRGHVLEGNAPFEQTIAMAELKPGVFAAGDGYEKAIITRNIGEGISIRGEGPFTARLDGERVIINSRGRKRLLHVTKPVFMVRPQVFIDGQEWMAAWTDYPASGWGSYENTNLIALSVPQGRHELVLQNARFPKTWARPFEPLISSETRDKSGALNPLARIIVHHPDLR